MLSTSQASESPIGTPAGGSSSNNTNRSSDNTNSAVPSTSEESPKGNAIPIRHQRLGSLSNNSNSVGASTRPISIPANASDIFLFKGFLPLDRNSFPSHYMFNCNVLEGIGFLPDQMFQLFAQILAYEYIRKGQTIPNSVMSGLRYFQEINILRKRRIIPNEILPRERQVTTSMGAPLHAVGTTNNVTFIQHITNAKHPGIASAKPISESPVKSSNTSSSSTNTNNTQPETEQENVQSSAASSSTSQTSKNVSNNPPLPTVEIPNITTTAQTNHVNSNTPPPPNNSETNSNLVTIDPSQQLTSRRVKPQSNSLETNLTLIGLEACSYLCDSYPVGNAKFKELLVTPIVNPHLSITNSPNKINNSSNNSSTVSSDASSISHTTLILVPPEKQVLEKSKENSPKNQKIIEVITVDDETPTKPLPTKKATNNISTSNISRSIPSKSKVITTPVRQLELSSSDEESPEVVEEENKKRKRTTTKRKRKEKKTKKNHQGNDIYTVERVICKKIMESSEPEYLVKWLGYDSTYNSWVKESDFLDKTLIHNFKGTVEYEKKSK